MEVNSSNISHNLTMANNDGNTSNEVTLTEQPVWYWTLQGVISFITVFGNGLVVFLILTKRNLQISCNWFVLSLSVVDLLVGLFLPPITFICRLGGVSCNFTVFYAAFNTILVISVANTCMMTFDRYIGIVYPLKYQVFMTPKRVTLLLASSWIVPAILALLPFTWLELVSVPVQQQTRQVHAAAMLILFEFLPPVILLFMYLRILLTARKHRRQTAIQLAQLSFNQTEAAPAADSRARTRVQERSVRVIGTVVLLFVFCWTIDIYKSICRHYLQCSVNKTILNQVSLIFIYINSALNPLVYALLKRDIRTELKKLFRCS